MRKYTLGDNLQHFRLNFIRVLRKSFSVSRFCEVHSPNIRFEGAVWTCDGGATRQAGHPVARHGQGVLGVGRHAGEGGGDPGDPWVGGQAPIARLVVPGVPCTGVPVAEGAVPCRIQGQGREDRSCK